MKKLAIFCSFGLVLSLLTNPVFAIKYCKDFLEEGNEGGWTDGLRTWDEEWTLTVSGDVEMDIWINDIPEALQTGGVFLNVLDSSNVTIVDVKAYDDDLLPGPWNSSLTGISAVVPGQIYSVTLKQDALVTPKPGGGFPNGDIILVKVTFHCEAEGDADITIKTIPSVGTIGSPTKTYDPEIDPNTIILYQVENTESTTTTSEANTSSSITSSTSTSTTTTILTSTTSMPISSSTTITPSSSTTTTVKGICVAERIYGENTKEVERFRHFRDNTLSKTLEGQEITRLYYEWSPAIVKAMEEGEEFIEEVKAIFDGVLPLIRTGFE